MHGYQVLGELDRLFGGEYEPSTGTVYPAVTALEEEGLIVGEDDGRRTTYRLAPSGTAALEHRREALAALEVRTGVRVRPDEDLDAVLARVRVSAQNAALRANAAAIVAVLEDTCRRLGQLKGSRSA
jgi:DNA-binding PadR family transcriptional regulator